ncbi:MAG: glycosyltransferase, partial [Clostridia bacterium]|nr:glycosyltransferase [Clostridia bacterium]
EAMSLAKPTIATDTGGNSQLVKNSKTGLLVGPADTISLAEAMDKLSSDKSLYETCSMGAKELYENNFSADIMVSNLEKLYKELQ